MPSVLDTVSLLIKPPMQAPGYSHLTPEQLEQLLKQLNDTITQINNNQNDIVNNLIIGGITSVSGVGGGVRPMTIAYTTPGRSGANLYNLTKGGELLQLHSSGQLIVAWKEFITAGNTAEIFLKKSLPPYMIWTNLEGTSQEPTVIAPAYQSPNEFGILICENKLSNELNVFNYDADAGQIKQYIFQFDGLNFSLGTSNSPIVSTAETHISDVISTDDSLILIANATLKPAIILRTSTASPTSWAEIVTYDGVYFGGVVTAMTTASNEHRLIDLGDGRILALFEALSPASSTALVFDWNIAWAMSTDGGLTWPVGDPGLGANEEIGVPGQETGFLFPQTALGLWDTATLIPTGSGSGFTHASWNAAKIGGTSKVGLVFLALPNPSSGGTEPSGVMYAEFNADTETWTAQADIVRLTPANVSGAGGYGTIPTSGGLYFSAGGAQGTITEKCVCASDGIVRCLWLHGHDGAGTTDRAAGIHYRRLTADADATDTTQWFAQREAIPFDLEPSGTEYFVSEFIGCKQGLVTVNQNQYFPVMWVHHAIGSTSKGMTYAEIKFALLPVALLDLP